MESFKLVKFLVIVLAAPEIGGLYSPTSTSSANDQLSNWALHKSPKLSPYASDKRAVNVPSLVSSLTVGPTGPILLSDMNLIESLTNFVHEPTPERRVHAKGGGAHGYFVVINDITSYTKASVFSTVGKKTPIFARFSTAIGESGTPDTVRDNRGFAVKFYTDQGVWNFAGCNIPVFRIRDPILFPPMIHAAKRHPSTHLRSATTQWDFFSQRPEATLNTLISFSDIGIPDGFRFMNGFSIHTYKLVNAQGQIHYARFNFISNQGLKNLTQVEAEKLVGKHLDYAIQDLFDAIARKEYPSWTLFLQILTVEQVKACSFNVFDLTKILPEDEFPMTPVGQFILTTNPLNYFSEVENAAFSPADLVPGIEISERDPVLQARSFAYRDAQRHRLGSNFDQLPINKPLPSDIIPYSYLRNGRCNHENYGDGPNYFPNSYQGPGVDPNAKESTFHVEGIVDRYDTKDQDNFSQSKKYLKKLTQGEMERLVQNLGHSLSKIPVEIQQRQIANYEQVDTTFAMNLKNYIANYSS